MQFYLKMVDFPPILGPVTKITPWLDKLGEEKLVEIKVSFETNGFPFCGLTNGCINYLISRIVLFSYSFS